jgi:hypothetical protein
MMKTGFRFAFSTAIAVGLSTVACGAAQLPSYWRKSMTNDPATNYFVAQSMKPLASADAQALRIVKLAGIAGGQCKGSAVNRKALQAYKIQVGYSKIKGKAYDDAAFLADDSFKYFDYGALAHLCAGTDYLFGPDGHLAPGVVRPGKGLPKASYDPRNPYVRVSPLMKKPL